MKIFGLALTMAGAALCGGCSMLNQSMRPTPLVEYAFHVDAISTDTGQVVQNVSGFSSNAVPIIPNDLLRSAAANPTYRDWLQDGLLQRSDILCGQYIDQLYNMVAWRKLALDEVTLIANAVGAFSTTASVTRAMTLVGAISSGSNAQFDADMLQSQMITLIITQIKRNREQILGQIMEQREKQGTKYYVSLAVRDAERYHQQCSFIAAMTGLTEAAQKPSPSSQAQSNAAQANAASAEATKITSAASGGTKSGK